MKPRSYLVIGTILTVGLLLYGVIDYYQNKKLYFSYADSIETLSKDYDRIEDSFWLNQEKYLVVQTKNEQRESYLKQESLFKNMFIAKFIGNGYLSGKTVIKNENDSSRINKNYFIENIRRTTKVDEFDKNEKLIEAKVVISKINSTGITKWKTFDLLEIAKKNNLAGKPSRVYKLSEDEQFFRFSMDYDQEYLLRLADGTISLYNEKKEESIKSDTLSKLNDIVFHTNFNKREIMRKNGLYYSVEDSNVVIKLYPSKKQSNVLFFEKYPELKDRQKKLKKYEKITVYFLLDQPNGEQILELLTPKGEDPFSYKENILYERGKDIYGEELEDVVLHSYSEFIDEISKREKREEEKYQINKQKREVEGQY